MNRYLLSWVCLLVVNVSAGNTAVWLDSVNVENIVFNNVESGGGISAQFMIRIGSSKDPGKWCAVDSALSTPGNTEFILWVRLNGYKVAVEVDNWKNDVPSVKSIKLD